MLVAALKAKFPNSKELEKLSEHFVMVNIMDDEEPQDKKYTPDGGYIPRILFAGQLCAHSLGGLTRIDSQTFPRKCKRKVSLFFSR